MNQFTKLLIVAALACVDVLLLLSKKRAPKGGRSDSTLIIPALYLDMLDPANLKRSLGTYSLPKDQLLSTGLTLARAAEESQGDILLEYVGEETRTIRSRNHAVVAMDEYGCYIQRIDSNDMYLLVDGQPVPRDEIEINEDVIIYLGKQPIRFRYPRIITPPRGSLFRKLRQWVKRITGAILGFSGKKRRTGGDW